MQKSPMKLTVQGLSRHCQMCGHQLLLRLPPSSAFASPNFIRMFPSSLELLPASPLKAGARRARTVWVSEVKRLLVTMYF